MVLSLSLCKRTVTQAHKQISIYLPVDVLQLNFQLFSALETVNKMTKIFQRSLTILPISKPAHFPVFIERRHETFPNQYIST